MVAPKYPHDSVAFQLMEPSPAASELMKQIATVRPPRIERRRIARLSYRTQAWLQPVDETGALRSPLIHTRDLDQLGLGFIARHDLAVLGRAVLHLPSASGRTVRMRCQVRRSRDFTNGWYEGFVEFEQEQAMFAVNRLNPA